MCFIHFGMMEILTLKSTFTLNEIANFTIYFLIFYFYLVRASDLIENKNTILKRLRLYYYVQIVLMLALAPYIFKAYPALL